MTSRRNMHKHTSVEVQVLEIKTTGEIALIWIMSPFIVGGLLGYCVYWFAVGAVEHFCIWTLKTIGVRRWDYRRMRNCGRSPSVGGMFPTWLRNPHELFD